MREEPFTSPAHCDSRSSTEMDSNPSTDSPPVIIPIPVIFSVLAMMIAIAVVVIQFQRIPFGRPLSEYSFNTPEDALRSEKQIIAEGNLRALMEIAALSDNGRIEQQRDSLQIHRVENWEAKRVLYVSYQVNGQTLYQTPTFVKETESGLWRQTEEPYWFSFDSKNGRRKDPIYDRAAAWRKSGKLE